MRASCGVLPMTVTSPLLGWIRSPMIRSSVDFPQPDGPIRETNSPSPISRSIPCTATTPPWPNSFETPESVTTLMAVASQSIRVDRSLQTDARAKPARLEAGTASGASCHVLRRSADDDPLDQDDDQEERDPEQRRDQVRRPQDRRRGRVVLVEVADRAAETVLDRRRELTDDRADDARCRRDLEGGEQEGQRGGKPQLPEDLERARG